MGAEPFVPNPVMFLYNGAVSYFVLIEWLENGVSDEYWPSERQWCKNEACFSYNDEWESTFGTRLLAGRSGYSQFQLHHNGFILESTVEIQIRQSSSKPFLHVAVYCHRLRPF